jgi:hypothetical protein
MYSKARATQENFNSDSECLTPTRPNNQTGTGLQSKGNGGHRSPIVGAEFLGDYEQNISSAAFVTLLRLGGIMDERNYGPKIETAEKSEDEEDELIRVALDPSLPKAQRWGEGVIRPPTDRPDLQGHLTPPPQPPTQSEDQETPKLELYRARLHSLMERVDLRTLVKVPCPHTTPEDCMRANDSDAPCPEKIHFVRIFNQVTELGLGDCRFLSSCKNSDTCPYVHYDTIPAGKPKMLYEYYKFPKEYNGLLPKVEDMLKHQDNHGLHIPVSINGRKPHEDS